MKQHRKTPYCTICSSEEELKEFKAQYICKKCVHEVLKTNDGEKKHE